MFPRRAPEIERATSKREAKKEKKRKRSGRSERSQGWFFRTIEPYHSWHCFSDDACSVAAVADFKDDFPCWMWSATHPQRDCKQVNENGDDGWSCMFPMGDGGYGGRDRNRDSRCRPAVKRPSFPPDGDDCYYYLLPSCCDQEKQIPAASPLCPFVLTHRCSIFGTQSIANE